MSYGTCIEAETNTFHKGKAMRDLNEKECEGFGDIGWDALESNVKILESWREIRTFTKDLIKADYWTWYHSRRIDQILFGIEFEI